MKFHRLIFMVGISFLAFFIARTISLAIFHPYSSVIPDYEISTRTLHLDPALLPDKQFNFLLIQLNDSPSPKPIAIWWVAVAPETPVTLVSLYPNSIQETQALVQDFKITEDNLNEKHVSEEFIARIESQDIPFDGYLVLEPTALAILVDSLQGLKINGITMTGEMVTSQMISESPQTLQGRSFQSDVWANICRKAIFAGSTSIFQLSKEALSAHTIISPDFPVSLSDIQLFLSSAKINQCEVNLLNTDHPGRLNEVVMREIIYRRNNGN